MGKFSEKLEKNSGKKIVEMKMELIYEEELMSSGEKRREEKRWREGEGGGREEKGEPEGQLEEEETVGRGEGLVSKRLGGASLRCRL